MSTGKTLGQMNLSELVSTIGHHVMVQEAGGAILTGVLTQVRQSPEGRLTIVVNEGRGNVVWPTQWQSAVAVDMRAS